MFENMFSELPHHNSHAIVLKNTVNVSSDKLWKEKQKKLHRKPILPDIHGTGRAAFFKMLGLIINNFFYIYLILFPIFKAYYNCCSKRNHGTTRKNEKFFRNYRRM